MFKYILISSLLLLTVASFQISKEENNSSMSPTTKRFLMNSVWKKNAVQKVEDVQLNLEDWSCRDSCKEVKKTAKDWCKTKFAKNDDKKDDCKDKIKSYTKKCYQACEDAYGEKEKWYKRWWN